jgi:hypothetical protein
MQGGEISGNASSSSGGGVSINGGTFIMKGGEISGNTASNDGGGVYKNRGTFRIVTGTIYGSNEPDESLRNTATNGAALKKEIGTATAQRGTFSGEDGAWESSGDLDDTNDTIKVENEEIVP